MAMLLENPNLHRTKSRGDYTTIREFKDDRYLLADVIECEMVADAMEAQGERWMAEKARTRAKQGRAVLRDRRRARKRLDAQRRES